MALTKCKECGKEISKSAKKCPNCGKPRSSGRVLGCGPVVWVLVIAIGSFIYFAGKNAPENGASHKAQSSEIELTPAMQTEVAAAIRNTGFNCPKVKLAYAKGEDSYGTVTKVFCGPDDRDGVYEKAVFRLTFLPDDMTKVEPWK